MDLNNKLVEVTTGVTDFTLAIVAVMVVIQLWRLHSLNHWKVALWCSVVGLIAIAALFGGFVHTFELSADSRQMLWLPINLALGLAVAITGLGAIYDFYGKESAQKLLLVALGIGIAFFLLTLLLAKGFIAFVVYQAVVMFGVITAYLILAIRKQLHGAGIIASAVGLNMVAAMIQQSSLSITLVVPFDHNGLFHLIQMVAIYVLGYGLKIGLKKCNQ
ncbi:DUF6962 family protein [Spartinivicinus ruber]|uniref:DUF6962 family protein n=1 Tax=Spartinivicinus ruber TaxID=2683272 RepID=UPI0013D7A93C|nr:hypothetical protein [Spartinivicinus ruber]